MVAFYQKLGLLLFPIVFSIGGFLGFSHVSKTAQPKPTVFFQATSSLSISTSLPVPKAPSAPTSLNKTDSKLPKLALTLPKFTPIGTSSAPTESTSSIPLSSFITVDPITSSLTMTSSSTLVSDSPVEVQDSSNQIATDAKTVVNIFCLQKVGTNSVASITGSGVVIDPSGIILTNAHVAEHVLISEYSNPDQSQCLIRTGSPAEASYEVSTIYVSSQWVESHYMDNNLDNPSESGESDYAFLQIGSAVEGNNRPQNFTYIDPDIINNVSDGDSVLVIGYPSASLNATTVNTDLKLEADRPSIDSVYNFSSNGNTDIVRTTATAVAEKGSSGGAMIDSENKLAGILTTIVSDPHSSVLNDIQAITIPYISNDLRIQTGYDLQEFLSTPSLIGTEFSQNQKPTLAHLLIENSQ